VLGGRWRRGVDALARVAHVLPSASLEYTAMVRMVAALRHQLNPEQYEIEAWLLSDRGPLAGELSASGAVVRNVGWENRRDLLGALRFRRALRTSGCAIVHQHYGGRSIRWLAQSAGVRVICHVHSGVDERRMRALDARVRSGADCVIATSRAVADRLRLVDPRVVYPGVERFPPASTRRAGSDRVIGTAARLVPLKGITYLIHAVGILRRTFPDLKLEIAGSGPDERGLRQEVERLDLEHCVTFHGWSRDTQALMEGWDVYVQPSLEEGFGMAVVEAMATALPVVAANVGGINEIVEDGRTGLLVPPGDATALARRLEHLLLSSDLRQAMGAAGQMRAQKDFNATRMAAETARIYDSLLDPADPRPIDSPIRSRR
jgi:glycosyltransferase involved in cell wall biosynthesis